MREFGQITAYGECEDHKGKVLLVHADEDGNITLTWIGQDEYRKVNE